MRTQLKRITISSLCLIPLSQAGCRGKRASTQAPVATHAVAFVNHIGAPMCEVAVNRANGPWGKNRLELPLLDGERHEMQLARGAYSVRATTCGYETVLILFNFEVDEDRDIRLHQGRADSPAGMDEFPVTRQLASWARKVRWAPMGSGAPGVQRKQVRVLSDCDRDMRLRAQDGTLSTMPAQSFARFALPQGQGLELVDAELNTLAAWVPSGRKPRPRIGKDCVSFAQR